MKTQAAGTRPTRVGRTWVGLILLATVAGCKDESEHQPIADPVRPVKIFVVSTPSADAGVELLGQVRASQRIDLAFKEVSGRIVELPCAGREGQEVMKGELLAQIDPKGFAAGLRDAEDNLHEAYKVLDLARAENERMEKMKGINPNLVSASMLDRTREKLGQAEARIESLESEVKKAESLLEYSSLRAPFAGVLTRCLMENSQDIKAGETIVGLKDMTHLEVLVDAPESVIEIVQGRGPGSVRAIARFPSAPGEEFPLKLKEVAPAADPATRTYRMVLEMPKPKDADLVPGTTGTVTVSGKGQGAPIERVLVPAIAVMTDPDDKSYVWLVDKAELRVHRREIRIGRLAGSDRIQVLSGLSGGERIVVAGVMKLAEGRQVRLWEDQEADKAQ